MEITAHARRARVRSQGAGGTVPLSGSEFAAGSNCGSLVVARSKCGTPRYSAHPGSGKNALHANPCEPYHLLSYRRERKATMEVQLAWDQALLVIEDLFDEAGLQVVWSVDLQLTRGMMSPAATPCLYHGGDDCRCQAIAYPLYTEGANPIPAFVCGNGERTQVLIGPELTDFDQALDRWGRRIMHLSAVHSGFSFN
jgi:hypothetical protein